MLLSHSSVTLSAPSLLTYCFWPPHLYQGGSQIWLTRNPYSASPLPNPPSFPPKARHVHSQPSPDSHKKEAESLGCIGWHPPNNADYRLTGKEEGRRENRDKYCPTIWLSMAPSCGGPGTMERMRNYTDGGRLCLGGEHTTFLTNFLNKLHTFLGYLIECII